MSKAITFSLDYNSLYKIMHKMLDKIEKNEDKLI